MTRRRASSQYGTVVFTLMPCWRQRIGKRACCALLGLVATAILSGAGCGLVSGLDAFQKVACVVRCDAGPAPAPASDGESESVAANEASETDETSDDIVDTMDDNIEIINVDAGAIDDKRDTMDAVPDSATRDAIAETQSTSDDASVTDAAGPSDAATEGSAACRSNVLAANAAVASTVLVSPTGIAAKAIDGNFTTRWGSVERVDPQWIYIDFGAPVFIDRVQIQWEVACAANYDLQISNDASNWTPLRSILGNTQGSPSPSDWSTAADHPGLAGVGRYLRVYGTARCTTFYGYSIWEMRAFGDTDTTCHP